jgi:hypoxanthine-DNA glycosylase
MTSGKNAEGGPQVKSFAPIVGDKPHVLILGSMPGVRSLQANEYYAHPRKRLWAILEALDLIAAGLAYERRTAVLAARGIALWDVLHSCERPGSLDASIVEASEEPNDIAGVLEKYPTIRGIAFNGAKAERAFHKHILPSLPGGTTQRVDLFRLPSTSPAHAISTERKIEAWRQILRYLDPRRR